VCILWTSISHLRGQVVESQCNAIRHAYTATVQLLQKHHLGLSAMAGFLCFSPLQIIGVDRSHAAEAGKTSSAKSSSDRHPPSSRDTLRPADMDSCVTINDETLLADDHSLHRVSEPSAANGDTGRANASDRSAPSQTVAANAEAAGTTATSVSRLFDLVNTDSPVAPVSYFL